MSRVLRRQIEYGRTRLDQSCLTHPLSLSAVGSKIHAQDLATYHSHPSRRIGLRRLRLNILKRYLASNRDRRRRDQRSRIHSPIPQHLTVAPAMDASAHHRSSPKPDPRCPKIQLIPFYMMPREKRDMGRELYQRWRHRVLCALRWRLRGRYGMTTRNSAVNGGAFRAERARTPLASTCEYPPPHPGWRSLVWTGSNGSGGSALSLSPTISQ